MNEQTSATPERIMQFAWSFAPPLAIEAAIRYMLFDVLARQPLDFAGLSHATGASPRGLAAIANLLDSAFIERFMLVFGPVSSVFDFLTFYALIAFFGAGAALFQTGWFMESMTTQVLVVFAIRRRRLFFRSRPNGFLVAMALGVVAVAIALPLLTIGHWFGFVAAPPLFFAYLAGATLAYLELVEIVKALFYRAMAGHSLQGHRGQH